MFQDFFGFFLNNNKNYKNNDYEHNFKIDKGIKKEEVYPKYEDEEDKQLQLALKQSEEEENLRKERERKRKEEEEYQLALKESEKLYYDNNNNNNNAMDEINNNNDNNKEIKEGKLDDNNKEQKEKIFGNDKEKEEEFDEQYGKCPITYEYMENPVLSPSGIYYEKSAIINWIEKHHIDPMTRERLTVDMLIEDEDYKKKIIEYRKKYNK